MLKQRSCVKILHNQIIETQKNCPEDEIIKDAKILFKLEKDGLSWFKLNQDLVEIL